MNSAFGADVAVGRGFDSTTLGEMYFECTHSSMLEQSTKTTLIAPVQHKEEKKQDIFKAL